VREVGFEFHSGHQTLSLYGPHNHSAQTIKHVCLQPGILPRAGYCFKKEKHENISQFSGTLPGSTLAPLVVSVRKIWSVLYTATRGQPRPAGGEFKRYGTARQQSGELARMRSSTLGANKLQFDIKPDSRSHVFVVDEGISALGLIPETVSPPSHRSQGDSLTALLHWNTPSLSGGGAEEVVRTDTCVWQLPNVPCHSGRNQFYLGDNPFPHTGTILKKKNVFNHTTHQPHCCHYTIYF